MSIVIELLNGLSKLLKALWLFIAGVIAVLAIYYLLTGVEQGIDVVIRSGETLSSGLLTMLSVFLWSFLVWYSSRTLSYIRQHRDDEIFLRKTPGDQLSAQLYRKYSIPTGFYQHIPRLLAYNCFVSVQVAIFHLPTFYALSGIAMVLVVALHNLFYFLLYQWFHRNLKVRRSKIYEWVGSLVIILYSAFLVYPAIKAGTQTDVIDHPLRHVFWLSLMALVMFLLQVVVIRLFILRRMRIDARRNNPDLRPSRVLEWLGFNPLYNAAEAPYFTMLNTTAAVAVLVYLSAIFSMPFAGLMGPMAFVLLALGVLTGLSNLFTLVSIRRSFNVGIILLALAFIIGQYRDPYTVRLLDSADSPAFSTRPNIRTYLERWFDKRLPMVTSQPPGKSFPVYLVLSNGGASRAGKWTSSVLSHLQDTSSRDADSTSFKDHVLCVAGASGGTVGNVAFYSLLRAEMNEEISPDEFSTHTESFFETDFLTYTLARLLGPDIFRHLVPFNIPLYNRADALEDVLSQGSDDKLLNDYFSKPITEVFDTTGALPLLFINTTQVDNGMPGVISSARLENSQRQDVLSLVDSMRVRHGKGDMRLSTAAVLSSRFPYVSPAGKVFDRYYVDGGYFDNSGAGVVLEFINELNQFLADTTRRAIMQYRDRFTFHIVHITNSQIVQRPSGDIHPLTNDLLSPLLTLAGMQGASTSIGDGILVHSFKQFNTDTANAMIVYSLYDESWDPAKHAGNYEEGYPMSWTLSDYQQHRMEDALRRANGRNLWKFGFQE